MKFLIFLLFSGFITFFSLNAQNGTIEIEVDTNINKFTCFCEEEYFIWNAVEETKNTLLVPVASFSCPKRMIEKDLVELFEAEEYPYIQIKITHLEEQGNLLFTEIEITIKETTKNYSVQMQKEIITGSYYFSGNQKLYLEDYQIKAPVKALGLVKVNPLINIEFVIPGEFVRVQ